MKSCSYPGCPKRYYAKGYCDGHRKQVQKGWELRPLGKRDKGTWGEPFLNSGGYLVRSRYDSDLHRKVEKLEHRAVMEALLGRELYPQETVHHINGAKTDNRPENLELWSHSHPYGQRVADKIAWAKELLRLYEPGALRKEAE